METLFSAVNLWGNTGCSVSARWEHAQFLSEKGKNPMIHIGMKLKSWGLAHHNRYKLWSSSTSHNSVASDSGHIALLIKVGQKVIP